MDFDKENRQDWIKILDTIFPSGIPKHCEWTNLEDVVFILNTVGSIDSSNHMFYPTGGGMDIESAQIAHEANCIEIYTELIDIVKPKALLFESFADPIWNYFRLETQELEPSGVYEAREYSSEELIEIEKGHYISRIFWDKGEYQGYQLPETARLITRHLRGAFVIFAKSSYYNRHSSTYDARHNKMSAEEFRLYIEKSNATWLER